MALGATTPIFLYKMKKLYSIIFALCIMHCALLKAQTECATIAELKALANDESCVYTGTAITTYYDSYNGVVMQDETGAILLQSSYLCEANATTVKVGMEITNVVGTFQQESVSYMTNIKVKKADIALIEVKKDDVSVLPQVVAFDDYMVNIDQYDGMAVKFENVNIRQVAGTTISEIYSLVSDAKLTVSFAPGVVVPARADLEGFLSADYSGKIFRVGSATSFVAYSYNTINNIKVGVTEESDREYELLDTFAVTNVVGFADKKVVYIQEEDSRMNYALRVVLSADEDVEIGDMLTGICGKFEPYIKGAIQKSATLTQSPIKAVKVVASGAQSRVLSNYIYTLTDNDMQNAYLYDGTLISLSGGIVTDKGNGAYSYVIENENGQGRKEIAIRVANVDDLSMYVGKECPVQGILDIAATYEENAITLILRSTADFLESNVQFESIEELILAGEPAGTSVTYELVNPVLVTYKFSKGGDDNSVKSHYAIVQDDSEGIVLSLGSEDIENVVVGDSIIGLKGVYSNMRGLTTDILDVSVELRSSISVKNRSNAIVPLEVTFEQLFVDKSGYSNRVVVVRGVKNNNVVHDNSDGSKWTESYFTQGDVRMDYTVDAEGKPYFTYYDNMDITGIVDDRVIGGYFSIWALSQAHIVNLDEGVAVEDVVDQFAVYPNPVSSMIYFEGKLENIVIYDITGCQVYTQSLAEQSLDLSVLNAGTYVFVAQSKGKNIIIKVMVTK